MKVAVFGHYDSRGGTTAIILPDNPTESDVLTAITRYDKEVFCIDEAGDIGSTAYGMEARTADKLVHRLLYGGDSVGAEDFMYVAQIYGVPSGLIFHDLEDHGSVLMDRESYLKDANFEARKAHHPKWMEQSKLFRDSPEWGDTSVNLHDWIEARIGPYPPTPDLEERIRVSLDSPIQLEFVAHGQDYEDVDDDVRERLIESLAVYIKNAEFSRWDDDAYGFILMP